MDTESLEKEIYQRLMVMRFGEGARECLSPKMAKDIAMAISGMCIQYSKKPLPYEEMI